MSSAFSTHKPGRILSVLPRAVEDQLLPMLEAVSFAPGDAIQRPGIAVRHGFILEKGLVTLALPLVDGRLLETGMAGPGGLIGASALLSRSMPACAAHARSSVRAWRMPVDRLRAMLNVSESLRDVVSTYVAATLDEAYELVSCTARHSVEQRLARWIVVASHHVDGEPLHVTHDALSEHLCVRRATITTALHRLEGDRAIFAARGTITVRDAAVLGRCSCGCHRVVRLGRESISARAVARTAPSPLPSASRASPADGAVVIRPKARAGVIDPSQQPATAGAFSNRQLGVPCRGTPMRMTLQRT